MKKTDWQRFWSRVDRTGTAYPTPERAVGPEWGPCWLFTRGKEMRRPAGRGYGTFGFGRKMVQAHRVAYEWLIGPVPAGQEFDHGCRVHPCVNPEHVEPVTHQENCLRGISPSAQNARAICCSRGHPYDEANTLIARDGRRMCRVCKRKHSRRASQRRRANGYKIASHLATTTHCPRGHGYDKVNTYTARDGVWRCRACRRAQDRARYAAKIKVYSSQAAQTRQEGRLR
jgi:hypothetical protein